VGARNIVVEAPVGTVVTDPPSGVVVLGDTKPPEATDVVVTADVGVVAPTPSAGLTGVVVDVVALSRSCAVAR